VSYDWRALTAADVEAWSGLLDAIVTADRSGERVEAASLAEQLADPQFDPPLDTIAVWSDRQLVAWGWVPAPVRRYDGAIRATFRGGVHPDHRGRGVGAQLFDRLAARTFARGQTAFPEDALTPSTSCGINVRTAVALFEQCGYRPERYFHEMAADLGAVAGFGPEAGVEGYTAAVDRAVLAAHRVAFDGHWGSAPPTDEQWRTGAHYTGSRDFRPDCSVVATAGDQVSGYVLGYEEVPGELYIGQVGVRPEARGRGLAHRLLRSALVRAVAAGYTSARLHVDSANDDNAARLYESVGFAVVDTIVAYAQA
jgi:mycothiol synthase